jgi:hypothetical protein
MKDRKWNQKTSDIYAFADDLGKALEAVEYDVWQLTQVDAGQTFIESQWATIIELVGLTLGDVIKESREELEPIPLAAKRLFQKELGIDPNDSESPWPPEDAVTEYERRYSDGVTETADLLDYADAAVGALKERLTQQGPFETIVDEHEGQLDLRATITMPNGFMVEVAIEDVMGSPDVALYAGVPDDPNSLIPGELVGRWDVARLNERSEA